MHDHQVTALPGLRACLDWMDNRTKLLAAIAGIGRVSPDNLRGYRALSDAGTATAHLDAKTRELIALAVGVARECDGYSTTHTAAAIKRGATREEVVEVLGALWTARRAHGLIR